jgi:hypothetical protein
LDTVVKNTSGASRWFSFLGPGGVRLANNQEYTVPGDLRTVAYVGRDGGVRGRTRMAALKSALLPQGGRPAALTILAAPAPILQDLVTGQPRMLTVSNGVVSSDDPAFADSQV